MKTVANPTVSGAPEPRHRVRAPGPRRAGAASA
jgi:hypothetical protein